MQTPTRPSAISRRVVSTPTRAIVPPATSSSALLTQSTRTTAAPRIGRSVTSSGLSMLGGTPRRGGQLLAELSNQSIMEEDGSEDALIQRERRALANQIKHLQQSLREERERADGEARDRRELEMLVDQTQRENEKCLKEKELWQDYSKKLIAEGAKHLGTGWIAETGLAQLPSAAKSTRRIPLGPTDAKANRRQSWYGTALGTPEGKEGSVTAARESELDGTVERGSHEWKVGKAADAKDAEDVLAHFHPALLTFLGATSAQQLDAIRDLVSSAASSQHDAEENAETMRALWESRAADQRRQAGQVLDDKIGKFRAYVQEVDGQGEEREGRIRGMLAMAREEASRWRDEHAGLRAEISGT